MKIRKTVAVTSALAMSILLLYAAVELAFYLRFERSPAAANFPPAVDQEQARQQDLEYFSLFLDLERSWTEKTYQAARVQLQQLHDIASELTDAEFEMAIARIVAIANNAHTKVREYARTPRYSRIPLRGHWFADGYFIIRAIAGFEQYLGAEIVAIEGVSPDQLLPNLRKLIGGPDSTVKKYAPYIIESPELMAGAGLSPSPTEMNLELRLRDGIIHHLELTSPFPASTDQIARSHILLAPQTYSKTQPHWKPLLEIGGDLPLYLSAAPDVLSTSRIDAMDATYIHMGTNNDVGDVSIKKFCSSSWESFLQAGDKTLILDLRFNGGGNFYNTRDCLIKMGSDIPADAHLYVIVAGPTFSAGMYSAAFALSEAGSQATLIGETMGDELQSWGEDNTLVLPNSGIEINYSTGMHDLQNKCDDWGKCFWGAIFEDTKLTSANPQIFVQQTFAKFAESRDPILEAITALEVARLK